MTTTRTNSQRQKQLEQIQWQKQLEQIHTKLALPMLKLDTNLASMNHFLDISRSLLAST
jgi:hypothetical protein